MSEYLIERREEDGLVIKTYYDQDGGDYSNPRNFDGNIGTMLTSHSRYELGDEQLGRDEDLTGPCKACNATGWVKAHSEHAADQNDDGDEDGEVTCGVCDGSGERVYENVFEWARDVRGARVVLKLGLIDHSGISMYVGGGAHAQDPGGWDSGTVGIIFDTPEAVKENWPEGVSDEKLTEALEGEVEEYDKYLRGELYGYVIEDDEGTHLDSCWGFLGHEYFEEEVKRAVGEAREMRDRERAEADYWRARDVLTVAS